MARRDSTRWNKLANRENKRDREHKGRDICGGRGFMRLRGIRGPGEEDKGR